MSASMNSAFASDMVTSTPDEGSNLMNTLLYLIYLFD